MKDVNRNENVIDCVPRCNNMHSVSINVLKNRLLRTILIDNTFKVIISIPDVVNQIIEIAIDGDKMECVVVGVLDSFAYVIQNDIYVRVIKQLIFVCKLIESVLVLDSGNSKMKPHL
uniref:Putative ovule protein n=1 Tax=Solanum chacoense TaxID=4108 RepID=A0A0V0HQB5_SOLCH